MKSRRNATFTDNAMIYLKPHPRGSIPRRYAGLSVIGSFTRQSCVNDDWEDEDMPPSREDLIDDDPLDPLPFGDDIDDDVDFDDDRHDPEMPLEDLWDNLDEG